MIDGGDGYVGVVPNVVYRRNLNQETRPGLSTAALRPPIHVRTACLRTSDSVLSFGMYLRAILATISRPSFNETRKALT